jgi:hypothetical protein
MAHRTNLAMQTFFNEPLVTKLESLLQTTYTYYYSSPKKHLEHGSLAKLLETKGLKLLHNVKAKWISMLSLMKRVLAEYKTLMVHMNNDLNRVVPTKINLECLCDVEVVMGLMCIMPMLKAVHALIKFVQTCDTFVCDFVTIVKLCCAKLYKLYSNLETKSGE